MKWGSQASSLRPKESVNEWTATNHLFISCSSWAIQIGEAYEEFIAKEPRALIVPNSDSNRPYQDQS